METKCAICKIESELTIEQLKAIYGIADRDMGVGDVLKVQEIMKGKTCTDNKFHTFVLTEDFSDQVLKVGSSCKTIKDNVNIELETMEKLRERANELRIELAETTAKYDKLLVETNLAKTKIEELEISFENLVGHRNMGLYLG